MAWRNAVNMNEMIEIVASAIADSQNVQNDAGDRTDIYFATQPWHMRAAKAAIQAMMRADWYGKS